MMRIRLLAQMQRMFISFVGKKTKLQCSPNYAEWPLVPRSTKRFIWIFVRKEYELEQKRKAFVLSKANTSWKNWKYRLRWNFDMYSTDPDHLANRPKNVKSEDWVAFIQQCHTEEERYKREHGKAVRKCVKLPHTSGRRGAAKTRQDLMKQSATGKVIVALHTKINGSCPFPEARSTLDAINQFVSLCPSSNNRNLDHDHVAKVCGRDGNGRVRGYPSGVSKTVLHAASPYKEIAQRELKNERRSRSNSNYLGID